EWLTLGQRQDSASFYGDIDLQDTDQLKIHLFPNESLYDLSGPLLDCASKVELAPAPAHSNSSIGEIELRRSSPGPNWTISLLEPGLSGLPVTIPSDQTIRTYRLC